MITTRRSMREKLVYLASATALAAPALRPEVRAGTAAFGLTCTTDLLPKGALLTGAFPCNPLPGC
jgi:hypothetical protein